MFLNLLVIIIMRFGENNVLRPKYINFGGSWGVEGGYMVRLTFFVYYSYKSMTYIKIKFYVISIFNKIA